MKSSSFGIHLATLCLLMVTNSMVGVNGATVSLSNDGPAVIGSPITFYAVLDHPYDSYIYEFQDMQIPSKAVSVNGQGKAQASFVYTKLPEAKGYRMLVKVWFTIFGNKAWVVAQDESIFELTYHLVAKLGLSQDDLPETAISRSIVASNRPANITFELYDPSKYFEDFDFSYNWIVDDHSFTNSSSTFTYNFTLPKTYNVSVIVFANNTEKNVSRNGQLSNNIYSNTVIGDLHVDGKTWITRDRNLDLNVSCVGGSGPFSFCRAIFFDNETASKNFSCHEPLVTTNVCWFHISWYFSTSGTYYLVMKAANQVSDQVDKFEINVYDINRQPQLSFVIIPVASSILAIVIIMVGIAYHLQQRQRYTVEVADFDFQETDHLNEKTFFERVRDSFSTSFKGNLLHSCRRRSDDYADLINDVSADQPSPSVSQSDPILRPPGSPTNPSSPSSTISA